MTNPPTPADKNKNLPPGRTRGAHDAAAKAAKRAQGEKIGRLVAVFVMPLLMLSILIGGYLFAMHSPTPHNVPIAVTGSEQPVAEFADALNDTDAGAVDLQVTGSAELAQSLVIDREVAGAVVLEDGIATVYTAGAAGSSQASTVKQLVAPHVVAQGLTLQSEDLLPLPDSDPAGLGAIFMMSALLMAGYVPFSFVLSNSPELLRFRRAVPLLAAWSAVIAAVIWLVTGPALGLVDGDHALPLLGVAWLSVFAVGSVQLLLTRLLGPMSALASMLLLMVLGVPASNVSMSIHMVPDFYGFLQKFLPAPAIGESLRSVLYFDGDGASSHILVLVVGALAGLLLTLALDMKRHKKNPDRPDPTISIPSLHGGNRPKSKVWRYGTLFALPLLMVAMMISVMLGAMNSTTPKDVPVAIVGVSQQAGPTAAAVAEQTDGMFDFTVIENADDARDLVHERTLAGAFVLPSAESPSAVLITNQAGGVSTQQIVTTMFTEIAAAQQMPMETDDVAPLPERDNSGNVLIYLAMGWVMAGFLIIVVGSNAAPALRPLKTQLPILALWAGMGSAFIWLLAGPIIGAIDGHFWPLFGAGAVAIFCISLFAMLLERLMGMLAILPVIGILIFLGMPASGGALPMFMLPDAFQWLHQILPMPASLEAIRSILYFDGDTVAGHLGVLSAWGLASLVLVVMLDAIKPPSTSTEVVAPAEVVATADVLAPVTVAAPADTAAPTDAADTRDPSEPEHEHEHSVTGTVS